MTVQLEEKESLDAFYVSEDPWNYEATADDTQRVSYLKAVLSGVSPRRTLDIGCGNGFVTVQLPGTEVVGCDLSSSAIEWARKRAGARADAERFLFSELGLFDLQGKLGEPFDLVVITGVLYPQYIGNAFSVVVEIVKDLLAPNGTLVSCHIAEWYKWAFPFTRADTVLYPYRNYTHRLEVYRR